MDFYERYADLCRGLKKSPSGVALEIGINKGTVSVWKNKGTLPNSNTLQKIADYFGVSTDYLLNGTETDTQAEEEDLAEMLQRIKDDPELRTLFSLAKDATPDDVRKAIAFIRVIKGEGFNDEGEY